MTRQLSFELTGEAEAIVDLIKARYKLGSDIAVISMGLAALELLATAERQGNPVRIGYDRRIKPLKDWFE